MQPIEIIVITVTLLFLLTLITRWGYKKIHHIDTSECSCCSNKMKKNFDKIRKELNK